MKQKILLLAIYILLITSCQRQPAPSRSSSLHKATSIDDMGREVKINHPPQRIVSLDPSVTEILFALELNSEIVGVTNYCDYPEQAKLKPRVGGYLDPNIEEIALLEPDLVVTTLKTETPKLIQQLENFGIQVFVLDPRKIEDIFDNIFSVAVLIHREEKANHLIATLRERLDEIKKKVEGTYCPRVFLEMGADPLISVGPGSFAHDLIEIAGGRNVFGQSISTYRRCTLEEILLADPEVIIICSMVSNDFCLRQRRWWKRWKNISAVRNNRIYIVEANLVARPGPRMVEGLEEIAKAIHPEKFPG